MFFAILTVKAVLLGCCNAEPLLAAAAAKPCCSNARAGADVVVKAMLLLKYQLEGNNERGAGAGLLAAAAAVSRLHRIALLKPLAAAKCWLKWPPPVLSLKYQMEGGSHHCPTEGRHNHYPLEIGPILIPPQRWAA